MERYEANLDGTVESGEPYTGFNERVEFKNILDSLRWQCEWLDDGRGGYYLFKVTVENKEIKLHVYLKRLTFGGREHRQYEKRAQFSAALDRRGFDIPQRDDEYSLILAIYKRPEFTDTISLCRTSLLAR